jgi:phage baseplate assembly protein W
MAYPAQPHFAYPFARTADRTGIQVNEQDTVNEIMSCQLTIINCPIGYRDDRPEYGWNMPDLHQAPINTASLQQALQEFEPRGPVQIDQIYDAAHAAVTLNVDVLIRSDRQLPE